MSNPNRSTPKRRLLWLSIAVVGLLSAGALWRHRSSKPKPVIVSKETTYLITPLIADGKYVDYIQALPAGLISNDPRDDLWTALLHHDSKKSSQTALDSIDVIYLNPETLGKGSDPSISSAYERARRRAQFPFDETTDREFAELIDRNEPWYQAVLTTAPSPVCVQIDPAKKKNSPQSLSGIGLPLTDTHLRISRAFLQRAMLGVARGQVSHVDQAASILNECIQRERQFPFYICEQTATSFTSKLAQLLLIALMSPDESPDESVSKLVDDFPERTERRDLELYEFCRLHILSEVQSLHQAGFESWLIANANAEWMYSDPPDNLWSAWQSNGMTGVAEFNQSQKVRLAVDCNALMRSVNEAYPRFRKAIQKRTYPQKVAAIEAVEDSLRSQLIPLDKSLADYEPATLTEQAALGASLNVKPFIGFQAAHDNLKKMLVIIRAVKQFHVNKGRYPTSLTELQASGTLPETPNVLVDQFTGMPFHYKMEGDGFVLSSAGKDRKHEQASIANNTELVDSIDDQVFRWPLNTATSR